MESVHLKSSEVWTVV